ncbi:hypothetical protein NDU88_007143 [Pleurodeles waltl]|uniref:Uncharacterized protein n=1 Tax=Pleurodeles waltl TaxID=8319 RepID=A0AAV7PKH1_PLEWA|nr:hypothetical protein NDU88_007143 [Pleurodeles waltl]
MSLWGRKKSEAESGRKHGAEARSIPGWLATDPFSDVAGLLNPWAAQVGDWARCRFQTWQPWLKAQQRGCQSPSVYSSWHPTGKH